MCVCERETDRQRDRQNKRDLAIRVKDLEVVGYSLASSEQLGAERARVHSLTLTRKKKRKKTP